MSRLGVVVNQWQDSEGRTLPNGFLYSYEVGSNTLKSTYSDAALTQPNPNPTQFDGAGRLFDVFLASGGYRLEVRDVNDVILWSQDDVFAGVDGTDLQNLENEIDQNKEDIVTNFGTYDEDSSPASATAYELTLKESSYTAPTAYKQGQVILFSPQLANTGTFTIDVEGLGAVSARNYDGTSVFTGGEIQPNVNHQFIYEGSIFRRLAKADFVGTEDIEDDAVTLAKMATGTEAKVITYDSSGNPVLSTENVKIWETFDESGQLTSGSSYAITNIDASATKIEVICTNLSTNTDDTLQMEIGYGATPTYLTTVGDYIGAYMFVNNLNDGTTNWSLNTRAAISAVEAGNSYAFAKICLEKFNDGTDDTWQITGYGQNDNGATSSLQHFGGRIKGSALLGDLSAIRLFFPTNSFDDGYITTKVYRDLS